MSMSSLRDNISRELEQRRQDRLNQNARASADALKLEHTRGNYDLDRQALANQGAMDTQRIQDHGAMARSMLTEATQNRQLNLQYGQNGYYTEQNRIQKLGQDRQFAIENERLKNEGYQYQNVQDKDGNESVSVFRRGKALNPEEIMDESDIEKLLAPATANAKTPAATPGAALNPGQGSALWQPQPPPSMSGAGVIRRMDGSTVGVDPQGLISRTPAPQAIAPPSPQPSPVGGRELMPSHSAAARAALVQPEQAPITRRKIAPQPAVAPQYQIKGPRDVVPFEDSRKVLDWFARSRKKYSDFSDRLNNRGL